MRTLLGMGFFLVLACGVASAQERIDAKKLIGKWERPANKEKKLEPILAEFLATKAIFLIGDPPAKTEFPYEVMGNKLMLTIRSRDGESTRTITITKLTETELVTVEGKEKTEYTRVKK
ncbi:MAG: hypothetical protein U0792_06000 [Gemmataceae bacterium]